MAVAILVHLVVGGGLVLFGGWSRRHVSNYVPVLLPPDERVRRERVLVRGAWACQAAGVVFVLMIIPLFFG